MADDLATLRGQLAALKAAHPVGTRARLALTLMLWTGQRREDIVIMGRQHLRKDERGRDIIRLRQIKTGTEVDIPVMADELREAIASIPPGQLTFLATSRGVPQTKNGFSNDFLDWCRAAGVPAGYTAHGLRKAFCCRLADAGVSAQDIATISGHLTLSQVQKYIAKRNKRGGAIRAMTMLVEDRKARAGGTK